MAAWPSQLPPPALDTLNETPPDNTIRSSMDKGPDKTRRRTTANTRPLKFTIKLSKALVAVLDSFYVNDIFSGSVSFDYIHPRTLAACTARFVSPPNYNESSGVIYNVPISLEIMP